MKQKLTFFSLLTFLYSCLCGSDRDYSEFRFRKELAPDFLPYLTNNIIFESDSGQRIQFDAITTTHEFPTKKECNPDVECCDNYVNREIKSIIYTSNQDKISVEFKMSSEDNADVLQVLMNKNTRYTHSFSSTFDLKNVLNHSESNSIFYDTLEIGQKKFDSIYEFRFNLIGYPPDNKNPESVFFSNSNGLIAFRYTDKSIWTPK